MWPTVLKIQDGEEFRQSLALAELAVRLCELKISKPKTAAIEKENLDPKKFLEQAWELIQSARQQVLRPQTDAEYLAERTGSQEAEENFVARTLGASRVPFKKLCDSERNKGDRELINGVQWKVYTTERGFDDLFVEYWRDIGAKWKANDHEVGTMVQDDTKGNRSRLNLYSEDERKQLAILASDKDEWENQGQILLEGWKRDGMPPQDFLALAKFRRERDKRSANLKKNPKGEAQTANGEG